jgi:hypothetical protein
MITFVAKARKDVFNIENGKKVKVVSKGESYYLHKKIYRECSIEELTRIIGNDLSFSTYNRLPGKDASEKATLLQDSLLEEYKQTLIKTPIELSVLKPSTTNRSKTAIPHLIDFNNKFIEVTIDQLFKHLQTGLKEGKLEVDNIDYSYVETSVRNWINWYIQDKELSIIFNYNGKRKILIYNS